MTCIRVVEAQRAGKSKMVIQNCRVPRDASRHAEADITYRGAGYTFGATIVRKFLELNGMNHILRAHQLCMEGYSVLYGDQLSTVWSAPNYCYR